MQGQAIWAGRLKPAEVEGLRELLREATAVKDLAMWRRAKCVLGYIDGRAAIDLAKEIGWTVPPSRSGSVGTMRRGPTGSAPGCHRDVLRD
jgi:hypothetical protein